MFSPDDLSYPLLEEKYWDHWLNFPLVCPLCPQNAPHRILLSLREKDFLFPPSKLLCFFPFPPHEYIPGLTSHSEVFSPKDYFLFTFEPGPSFSHSACFYLAQPRFDFFPSFPCWTPRLWEFILLLPQGTYLSLSIIIKYYYLRFPLKSLFCY